MASTRSIAVVIVLGALSCSTGCSLIGLGVGAAVPRWEHDVPPEKIASYQEGTAPVDLDVQVSPEVARAYSVPSTVRASYSTFSGLTVTVSTPNGDRAIPFRELERVDVKVGTFWAQGLATGLVVDAAVAVLVGILLVAASSIHFSLGGGGGW